MSPLVLLFVVDFTLASSYRESTGIVTENSVYEGPLLKSRMTNGVFACSHFCMSSSKCFSFNYKSSAVNQGLCQLHTFDKEFKKGKDQPHLTFKPGYVFVRTDKLMPHSCADHLVNGYSTSGPYDIYDGSGNSYPVYCDMSSEPGTVWTLVMSTSFEKALARVELSKVGLIVDQPVNQENPNWQEYRLPLRRMQELRAQSSLWRITCSIEQYGVDYKDYASAEFVRFDPLTFGGKQSGGECKYVEYINVRGRSCGKCEAAWWQENNMMFHHDSSVNYCDFGNTPGAVTNEDNFGYYIYFNGQFRCTAHGSSTTNYWFGRSV